MEKKDITKEYTNGEVTVVWKPDVCIHSGICFGGLLSVFNPKARPWVNMDGAPTERIKAQIDKCPSKALSYYMNGEEGEEGASMEAERIVEVSQNGPLLVYGKLKIKHSDGREEIQNKVTALCRCGASENKPYCDGGHKKAGFKG